MRQWLLRLRRRRHCVLEPGAVLHDTARIINMSGGPETIRIGSNAHVRGELLTFAHGGEIRIGAWCYIGEGTRIWAAASVRLGDRVLIAHNVTILDSLTHPLGAAARHDHFRSIVTTGHPRSLDLGEQPVGIGDDAWIGCESVLLRGVHLGQGAIVGAGSVVTENVPAWTIVAGNPARVVRELRPDER